VLAVVGDLAAIWAAVMATVIAMVFVGDVVMRVRDMGRAGAGPVRRTINEPRPAGEGGQPAALRTTASRAAIGNADAKVVMIEYSDFQCPFCARYTKDIFPKIKATFIDTGRVRYEYRSFPLSNTHPLAERAAEASKCALEQRRYPEMHDALFAHQSELDDRGLRARAAAIGADPLRFDRCMTAGMVDAVASDRAEGVRLGVKFTPTFLVGVVAADGGVIATKRLLGALPYEAFEKALESTLVTVARQ
jgi:protein-disulfide isomerase